MATIEERAKELEDLYTKAITPDNYHVVYMAAINAANEKGVSLGGGARIMLPGLWAHYYELRKSKLSWAEGDNFFSNQIKSWLSAIARGDIELRLNYSYLLSVVLGELEKNLEGAGKVNEEMQTLVKNTGNIGLALRVINAQGLTAMQKKDWPEAITIFRAAERNFPEALGTPEALQHLGNTLNNRGLAKLNLSDVVSQKEKGDLICSAIVDLWNAEDLYMKVIPPPLKHIDGIINRFIMAATRLLSIETADMIIIAQKIKTAFEAKNRDEAKRLIFELKETKVKSWDKIEVGVPAPTMTFIGSIQIGLRLAEEFLEKHKEAK
jgi:tetratricopeptide (TPR) repeat protein